MSPIYVGQFTSIDKFILHDWWMTGKTYLRDQGGLPTIHPEHEPVAPPGAHWAVIASRQFISVFLFSRPVP
jgi:hypothetical protein